MFKKLFIFALIAFVALTLTQRENLHLQEQEEKEEQKEHELFGFGGPYNPKNRSKEEVCKHYGGGMCTFLKIVTKCCVDGVISKNTQCGKIGCRYQAMDVNQLNWNY